MRLCQAVIFVARKPKTTHGTVLADRLAGVFLANQSPVNAAILRQILRVVEIDKQPERRPVLSLDQMSDRRRFIRRAVDDRVRKPDPIWLCCITVTAGNDLVRGDKVVARAIAAFDPSNKAALDQRRQSVV